MLQRTVLTGFILASFLTPLNCFSETTPVAFTVEQYDRTLKFYNTHTRERLNVTYKSGGEFLPDALEQINRFLRDHRRNEVADIDPTLLDFLFDLQKEVGNIGEVHVVCGYRTKETNDMLRQAGRGVAKKSQHVLGHALDFRLPGTDTQFLRDAALRMQRGGVGYYKTSDFIHIDTGRVRWW